MSGKYWTTEPDGYIEPQITNYGYAATPAVTLISQLKGTVQKHGDHIALYQKKAVNVSSIIPQYNIPRRT